MARPPRPLDRLPPGPGRGAAEVVAHQLARIYGATIGIVAEQGYGALKVRDVVSYAEVSTRTFYELFRSKEDCFLRTYDLISRRASHRIIAAQADEPDWRMRPQLALEEFLRGLEQKPWDAHLALVEAYSAGVASLERAWRAERVFEGMLADALARTPAGVPVSPLVAEGIVGGIASVSRERLLGNKTALLGNESGELIGWTLTLVSPDTAELADLDRRAVRGSAALRPLDTSSPDHSTPARGDRALILDATVELAVTKGYAYLTAPRIRSKARVSRRKFNAYFDDVEDCYLDALEQRAGEALALAARAQSMADSWGGGAYRAIAALCEHVADDAFLARALLDNDFPPSAEGARSQRQLVAALTALLSSSMPSVSHTAAEASTGALWSLFHHHIVREWTKSRKVSATLSYLLLAPTMGPTEALAAIRAEQVC